MPPTPFIGISLLIHTLIILLHKIFHWVPRRKILHKKPKMSTSFLSVFVVTLVFWFVVISAVVLVYVSIQDRHSIFRWLAQEKVQEY
jgi:hypothetical protein